MDKPLHVKAREYLITAIVMAELVALLVVLICAVLVLVTS